MDSHLIKKLEDEIIYHKQKYYRGEAEISDEAYDAIEDKLRALAPDSYALQVVGYQTTEKKIRHERPMLSLSKSREPQEIISWMDAQTCMISDKMDGSSASLVFEQGVFRLAKTRGDGTFGENLTKYFEFINTPKILFDKAWRGKDIEIRGEVCITRSNFDLLCDEMVKRKLDRPNSIRNIVAGQLHKKNDLDLCRYLDFIGYEIFADDVEIPTEQFKFELLEREGFVTPRHEIINNHDGFLKILDNYIGTLEDYKYLTDGLVISVNDIQAQIARGYTGHHPKGKMAFKLKSDTTITTIKDIVIDVGRTGRLTFVGVVEPVELSGATVQRVTFNNVKYIQDHHLNPGAEIEITRSGEVIPKHERTVVECGEFVFPADCPLCGTTLVLSDTRVDLMCTNPACKSRVYGRVAHWISVVGIDNIGDGTLEKFFEQGLVKSVEDLYDLKAEQICDLEKLGKRSAKKIVDNIAASKNMPIEKLISGLGVDGLGKGVAKLLVERYPTIEQLKSATRDELIEISGIGEVLAENVINGMEEYGWPLIAKLIEKGITIEAHEAAASNVLETKTFVITGKLSRPRSEIKKFIEDLGGKVTGSVSANTSYLVCNEQSSSSKYKKAQQLKIDIITEDQLFAMS